MKYNHVINICCIDVVCYFVSLFNNNIENDAIYLFLTKTNRFINNLYHFDYFVYLHYFVKNIK